MYRPSVINWGAHTGNGISIWGNQLNTGPLYHAVDYHFQVLSGPIPGISSVAGQAEITQVYDDSSYPEEDNTGSNMLDTVEAYTGTTTTIHVSPPHNPDPVPFSDNPGNRLYVDTTSLVLNFRDYIRFQPSAGPGPNIFVTLGKVTWNVDAWADIENGIWQIMPFSYISLPALDPTSVEFPYWEGIYTH